MSLSQQRILYTSRTKWEAALHQRGCYISYDWFADYAIFGERTETLQGRCHGSWSNITKTGHLNNFTEQQS